MFLAKSPAVASPISEPTGAYALMSTVSTFARRMLAAKPSWSSEIHGVTASLPVPRGEFPNSEFLNFFRASAITSPSVLRSSSMAAFTAGITVLVIFS